MSQTNNTFKNQVIGNGNALKFFLIITLISIFLLLIIEISSLILLNFLNLNKNEIGSSRDALIQIYGERHDEYKKLLSEKSGWKYIPFVEYTATPKAGLYSVIETGVAKANVRCHYTDHKRCIPLGGKNEIWVFGGSTTYGVGVMNQETIPAFLAEIYHDYNVINFGIESYYSSLERILFNQLLTSLPPPKAAVFIDGLNDFYYARVNSDGGDKSPFSEFIEYRTLPGITGLFNSILSTFKNIALKLNTVKLIVLLAHKNKIQEKISVSDEVIRKTSYRVITNFKMNSAIGQSMGINVLNVLQPVPLFGYGHKSSNVPIKYLAFEKHHNSGKGYELLHEEHSFKELDNTFLNLALIHDNLPMYIDTVHYSPTFNKKIAKEISSALQIN